MSVSLSEVIVNINFVSCRSCFELLLSVPENEIPFEAWVQFHHSVQVQHCDLIKLFHGRIPGHIWICLPAYCVSSKCKAFITSPQVILPTYIVSLLTDVCM